MQNEILTGMTAEIAASYLSHNSVSVNDIPDVIRAVYGALAALGQVSEPIKQKPTAAVSVRASVKPDYLLSMINGKPYKTLKRHIALHGYTPETYREAFDLPRDYPIVSTNYSEKRRDLALANGLGHKTNVQWGRRRK